MLASLLDAPEAEKEKQDKPVKASHFRKAPKKTVRNEVHFYLRMQGWHCPVLPDFTSCRIVLQEANIVLVHVLLEVYIPDVFTFMEIIVHIRFTAPANSDFEDRIRLAVDALRTGRGVLLMDDENRENEGDLIFAAEKMTVPQMALMIRECSGIVCLCMPGKMAQRLGLALMVEKNTSRYGTAFTVSIEAASGVTTGVSAADRICTVRTAVCPDAKPGDLNRPGHIFPLIARDNGVLERAGHTEGSVDLMKMANLSPFAVLCELTNVDGSMARLPEIRAFSLKHGFPVVTIADIRKFRSAVSMTA